LLTRLFSRWRRATRSPARQPIPVREERPPNPRVPAEYLPLYTYLEHRHASITVLTFDQLEALLGRALPTSARTDLEWWTAAVVPADRHSHAWTAALRKATPNLLARNVTFERLP
jgi:hypothetical protein